MACNVLLGVILAALMQLTSGNLLDVTCINFNPIYDPGSSASYAAILNGADVTSTVSFQRSVDLDTGMRSSTWCSHDDDATECGLPQGSTIDSSGTVTFQDTAQDKFGVYGCRAERYNWTTATSTMFIRDDAHFSPGYFTMTASLDEEVRLVMNTGSPGGSGSLLWRVNHESGGQTDLSSSVSGNQLYISKANKEDHAGIHHYFYDDQPNRGGLVRLIVRACLDNLWGPDCQYTCPTCYNGGVCDDVSGRCICSPGFSGDHCHIACEAGKFGKDCTGSCSSLEPSRTDCSGAVFCLPDPYGCSCAAGWTGLTCDQVCPDGSYGAGCTQTCHCESSLSCDSATGACSNGCETGWTGDQCQVTILDITAMLRRGGIDDANDNFLGIFMIGDSTVTSDPSLKYYIGREVDTGPGETGHGATSGPNGIDRTTSWTDTGLPQGTSLGFYSNSAQDSLRAQIDKDIGGEARVGAYRMSIDYRGWQERTVLLNEYRGDSNSEVWPEKLSSTVGIGETVTLHVLTESSVDTTSLRWRHNGGSEITEWNGQTSVTINDVRRSDEGIYECYVEGNRETGKHAIMNLILRGCPSSKYGFNCSQDCPVCYAGGVCHDVTGECVCRPGFQGDNCEIPCSDNHWGKSCSLVCSSSNPGCPNRLFSPPIPVGMSCINGYTGNRCLTACDAIHFGADCELDCNCDGTCNRESGCQGTCSSNYEGTYCQALRSDLDCPSGYFGTLCNYPCHCEGDVACQRSNGHCPNGIPCADGWAGSDCQHALPRLLDSPWVSSVTSDSVLLIWNAWTDGYDYGNGPVHSYQVDYIWTDDEGNTGQSDEPIIVFGDSTADITGLFRCRYYDFYISVRREVEGQPIAGVRNGPVSARTDCGDDTITLQCGYFSMAVMIPLSLVSGVTSGEDLHLLPDDNCTGMISEDEDFIVVTTNLTDCGNTIKEHNDYIVYSNTVVERKNANPITRLLQVYIPFSCSYNRSERVGLRSYQITNYQLNLTEVSTGHYAFALDIFRDEDFEEKYADWEYPVDVPLNEDLYFGASVPSQDRTLDLSIRTCVATPSASYNDEQWVIIQDGCAAETSTRIDDESLGFVAVTMNTFRFDELGNRVYIHCDLLVCKATSGNETSECDPACVETSGIRVRRDVIKEYSLSQKRITKGPLKLKRSANLDPYLNDIFYDEGKPTPSQIFNPWMMVIMAIITLVIIIVVMFVVLFRKTTSFSRLTKPAPEDDEVCQALLKTLEQRQETPGP